MRKRRMLVCILLILSFLLSGCRNNKVHLDVWLGEYYFFEGFESTPEDPFYPAGIAITYTINIYSTQDEVFAEIINYGYQTYTHLKARVLGDGRKIDLLFKEYYEDHIWGTYTENEVLLTLFWKDDQMYTTWGEIGSETAVQEGDPTGIYYEKIA